MKNRWWSILLGFFGTFAIIALVTIILKYLESFFEIQVVALIYLVPVLLCTILWGLSSGSLGAVLSFLAINYYFVQPYYTLLIHKSQDLITLIIFLLLAVIISRLVGQARKGTDAAKAREREAVEMYELTSALTGLTEEQEVTDILANRIFRTFQCQRVEVIAIEQNGKISATTFTGENVSTPSDLILAMKTARNVQGEIKVWLRERFITSTQIRLLENYNSQGALALERIRLVKRENLARLLEESDKIKTTLLNSVSHELRSPLAAIKASASSLRSGAVDWNSEARSELMATIEEETDQLNLLVGNLLDMSRIESGALVIKKEWNSIPDIIGGVIQKYRSRLTHYSLELRYAENLPLVPTDFVMMGQVFTNLLSNSTKYAPIGTPIKILCEVVKSDIQITFINQSPLVPEEHLDHIFDKFFRITKADKVTGTGLGLSICKGIVEAHGGKIWAENQPDGFSFKILLPLTINGALPVIPKDENDG